MALKRRKTKRLLLPGYFPLSTNFLQKNGLGKSFQNHDSVTPLHSNFAKLPPFLNAKK